MTNKRKHSAKMTHLKIATISILCLFFERINAQQFISFKDNPIKITELNSKAGQNNLVLSPYTNVMAFTDDGSEATIKTAEINRNQWAISVFDTKEGFVKIPLGIDLSSGIYFAEIESKFGNSTTKFYYQDTKRKISDVAIDFFKNKGKLLSGCISKSGKIMFLSFESNHSEGVEDIYFLKKKSDKQWGAPQNLGSIINSKFQEITPFLASDDTTLFFSSNRNGQGMDVFYAKRLDNTWRNWSEPQLLPQKINSNASEASFSMSSDGKEAFFVRTRNSDNYGDIYRVNIENKLPEKEIEKDTIPKNVEITAIDSIEDEIATNGKFIVVFDANSKNKIPFSYSKNQKMIQSSDKIAIDSTFNGKMEIKSDGYLPAMVHLDELKNGKNIIYLNKIEIGKTIALNHVLFKRGTASILPESYEELNLVVKMMEDLPKINILLKGHTDNRGDAVMNVRLSKARVAAVKKYLLEKGINAYRITGRGYGGNEPLYPNTTEENRQKNRRVEFEVVK